MADVKIQDLLSATTVADTDLFVVEDNADTKKITKANLVETLGINGKANKVQENWINATLLNGASNTNINAFYPLSFFKDEFGFVNMRGMVSGVTLGLPLMQFPVGYRCSKQMEMATNAGNQYAKFAIDAIGSVVPQIGLTESYSFDGIRFKADS